MPAAHLAHTSPPSASAVQQPCPAAAFNPASLYFKGHLLPHDTSTPSKSSLLRHLPAAQSFVQRQITPQSLLLLTASAQHRVQMGRRHQMWVTLSPVLPGRSDAGIWPSALHSSRPCYVQFPLLFSKDIWTLRGLEERLKAGSALQLLSLCLPASLQGRVQQQPQNRPASAQGKEKPTFNRQEPSPIGALLQPRGPQGCTPPTSSLLSQTAAILDPLDQNITVHWALLLLWHAEVILEMCAG